MKWKHRFPFQRSRSRRSREARRCRRQIDAVRLGDRPAPFYTRADGDAPRSLSADRAVSHRRSCGSTRATRCTGSNRATRAAPPVAVPAWRAGRRRDAGASPVFRPRPLAHRHLRSARRRPVDPARRDHRQFARRICRRYRAAAPRARHRRAGWSSAARGARPWRSIMPRPIPSAARPRPARHLFVPGRGNRVVSLRHAPGFSRSLARLCRASAGGRARRSPGRLLPPADRSRPGGPSAGGAGVERL